ncbi:AfsR/SARP family transcriptional regulator [Actinoplanes couchii]|uniref:SARP family transcriptional regulator n=1 Tax=Actinoplanes couchii TaxID=403638 RepID=A0ABQ3X6S7_9ACTN|nr:AfsR/SARP family transcriptional regulator [Actinoplanes couchii]MDR6322047.1 DNA-binding SARP family transcriptional activator [Actinoplanes couchii]GID54211.1 SARP family transcriptional regulator [Actinoplanes couchii]
MSEHARVEYRVLGPFEVLIGGQHLDLGGHRRQIVLACLVMEAGRVVPVNRLVTAVYGEHPPASARSQVQICVSALRRSLGADGRIITRDPGYLLEPAGDDVDLKDYELLLGDARTAAAQGRRDDAVARYREALGLWRGPALEGIDSSLLRAAAGGLTEQWLTAVEDCVDLELDLGRHRAVVAELTGLVVAHPLRERLRGQLMLALHRSGRQAEALDSYRAARRTLIDELGLEPGEWLQRLEHAILTSGSDRPVSADTAAATGAVPRMLPTDIADFTGRAEQSADIMTRLGGARERRAVPIVVIAGTSGIGKTALGVHVAHRLADDYPDGQLFADLRGHDSHAAGPEKVLERFLRALGVPGGLMPEGLDERAERYRDLLAGRRMLVLLDNAGDESQVLPLLPGDPRTAVVVTSRGRLGGLPGAVHVDLGVLDRGHSVTLLSRIAGDGRVRAEAGAAAELAELCGRLPLALRIAGARLSARPHWTLRQLAGRLADESRRLDELSHGTLGIRASISMTYDNIGAAARRLFRLLGILDAPDFAGWAAAALLDRPVEQARDLLDELADARLVEAVGGPGRYRFHDLIRVFARERLAMEESADAAGAARERALGALLFLTEEAHRRLHGHDKLQVRSAAPRWTMPGDTVGHLMPEPLAWLEEERSSLVAAVPQADRAGAVELCWELASGAVTLFEQRAYLTDWRDTHEVALAAADRAGDRRGRAVTVLSIGSLALVENRFADARDRLEEAAALFAVIGDAQGVAIAGYHLAYLERVDGRLDEAAGRYQAVLPVLRGCGDLAGAAYVLHRMAQVELDRGDTGHAEELLREALVLSRRVGSRRLEAQALHRFGHMYLETGEPGAAIEPFEAALAAVRELDDQIGQAYALSGLGLAHLRGGDHDRAAVALTGARSLAVDHGERLLEGRVAAGFGELALARGEFAGAVRELERALTLFRDIRAGTFEAWALELLATARTAMAEPGGVDSVTKAG